ncbi:hypothetical protein [Spiroplasma clarkii]|uniref:hypothetical protein n=1 Tax=Spiroplasma clarkii TaxID=2139 RepID=UPI001C999D45|nr:hypothetical protein [Spiroplasma clarkii]
MDSEHCAIWQCLEANQEINKIYLTASGGPFRTKSLAETKKVDLVAALQHPSWNMGAKITIDSATMFNKAFEILEVYHLFQTNKIVTLVHPESIIHSMVEFVDGSIKAQLSVPDMKQVINYFLNYPTRTSFIGQKNLNFEELVTLNLKIIDQKRFTPIAMAQACLNENNSLAVALNAANEVCVAQFQANKISFYQITKLVQQVFQDCPLQVLQTYQEIEEFDTLVRKLTEQKIREEMS